MKNKKMFIGACLLGVSLIFTGCRSSDSVNLNAPSTFHGTWKYANNDVIKITADELSVKLSEATDFITYEEYVETSASNFKSETYEIVQAPEYIELDQSIVMAHGILMPTLEELKKRLLEDLLKDFQELMESAYIDDSGIPGKALCTTRYLTLNEEGDTIKKYYTLVVKDSLEECKVADFTTVTAYYDSNDLEPTEYTKSN